MQMSAEVHPQFLNHVQRCFELFQQLEHCEPVMLGEARVENGVKAVYAFFENDKAIHVGRTRNLRNRLRGHQRVSHYSATFAFRCTRRALNKEVTYAPHGSRKYLQNDPEFRDEFLKQIERLKSTKIRYVEVSNPVEQYLLELYAHIQWGLDLDEFETH